MAVVITVADVLDGFDTNLPETQIQMLIDFIDAADTCLDASNIPDANQKSLKVIAVRHLVFMQSNNGAGKVISESAPNGASVSYSDSPQGSQYGSMLKQMDYTGCVVGLIDNQSPKLYMAAVGG